MDLVTFKPLLAGMFRELHPWEFNIYSQEYEQDLTRFVTAWAQAPMSLAETDLPTWIIFTRPGAGRVPPDQGMNRLWYETRDFECRLYVAFGQAGIDGEAERMVEPYLDPALALIHSHPLLQEDTAPDLCPGVQRGYYVKDTGVTTIPFGKPAPANYVGCVFTVRVEVYNAAPVFVPGQ